MTEESTKPGGGCSCGCGGNDERQAAAPPHNPPGRTSLETRVGEYGSLLAAMRDRLASPAYPALRDLTARTPDDPALALLDSWAVLGDLLTFHSERIAEEGYLRTAQDHRSLVLLGRLVGHRPRPGVAADTHLAYTVDRDPRAREDVPVVIPRGSRSHSVPAASEEDAQTYQTDEELVARWAWNRLEVRRRRPALLTPDDLLERPAIHVAGTSTSLSPGDRLLFLFNQDPEAGPAQKLLVPVARTRVDRDDEITAIALPKSPPPSLKELTDELRDWITEDPDAPDPRPTPSRLVEDFDRQVLAPLRADLERLDTPARFAHRLEQPMQRLREAQALAAAYVEVDDWFEQLHAIFSDLRERALELQPRLPRPAPGPGEGTGVKAEEPGHPALRALGALLPALRTPGSGAPPPVRASERRFAPDSALSAQLLSALDPGLSGALHQAWRQAATTTPPALGELLAMRVKAAVFGATAPLKPVQDERGRVIRQSDWPLAGGALTTMRIVFDTAGQYPVKAQFLYMEGTTSDQVSEPVPSDSSFDLGTGRVFLSTRSARGDDSGRQSRRAAPTEPGVTARMEAGLPERTLFVADPGAGGHVHVTIQGGGELAECTLLPGHQQSLQSGEFDLTVTYTTGSGPSNVEIAVAAVPKAKHRTVLSLDGVHDSVTVGSWVAVDRPGKGEKDGIPGDKAYAQVVTRVTAVRTVAYARFGITGRGTELTLAEPWLDEHDTLLSHIRDTTVFAGGEALRPADEPLGEDVHGNEIVLDELYEGLRPGRTLAFEGERTDIPGVSGVQGTELAVLAAVEQRVDPEVPGDHVHTVLTLTADLAHRYRRETVRIQGNVVPASHGESRDEAIGSGDAGRRNQAFVLWQSPLTWLPADTPLGAVPTLEVRVDGLLWHPVDSLAGRGPGERIYVIGSTGDGRTTVTFGDGVHGARLPTGQENVRARYRFGTGRAANVAAHRITQPVTRPLGVTGVTNPLPATGGADADGPGLTRRTVPLSVSALDRLVSVRDYEDFTRSRAGIGRAAARELFDGRRRLLHVTVAGADDVPIGGDADVLHALRYSLAEYGNVRLPVRVDVRELVLLVLAARVEVAPDHSWEIVEPQLRRVLLDRMGYRGRELGQPARLSEVLATAQTVPGVAYMDVDVFSGVPSGITPQELARLAGSLDAPQPTVPARLATYDERVHEVSAAGGETLTSVAARYGISLAELLRLNPDVTDTSRLEKGRSVYVFRGIRPAQLALFSPEAADTLILTEVTR